MWLNLLKLASMLQAYTVLLGLLAVGSLPTFRSIRFIELPYFIGLAVCTIYIGSHKSLTNKVNWLLIHRFLPVCIYMVTCK